MHSDKNQRPTFDDLLISLNVLLREVCQQEDDSGLAQGFGTDLPSMSTNGHSMP